MTATDTSVLDKTKFKVPSMWTVVLHNDDYTPMDFVIAILTEVFHLSEEVAEVIMLAVHNDGKAPVGKYTKEIAETKAQHVQHLAAMEEHPLLATAEEA